jgi:hypothetical protein
MRHPNESELALHAGGDLGWIARCRIERHLSRCTRCRDEVVRFDDVREMASELAEMPEVAWGRLAAEMKANIRLGLAAGECVRQEPEPARGNPFFTRARTVVALASVAVLVVTGLVLERPLPTRRPAEPAIMAAVPGMVELESTATGIQVGEGAGTLRFQHGVKETKDVTYLPGAQGSMKAQFVDPDTGYVTVTSVYAN